MGRRSGQTAAPLAGALAAMLLLAGSVVNAEEPPPPRLVVVVVVETLIPGQLERLDDVFIGGLRRLQAEGAVLTDCHHDHGVTESAPGYFALFSGRHPAPPGTAGGSGVGGEAGRRGPVSVADASARIPGTNIAAGSYAGISASAVGDWLREEHRAAHVFSIAGTEPAAVLMAGRGAEGVYWLDADLGRFVTSSYYRSSPHDWVNAYNALGRLGEFHGGAWERVIADTLIYRTRARPDSFPGEADLSPGPNALGRRGPVFDHAYAFDPEAANARARQRDRGVSRMGGGSGASGSYARPDPTLAPVWDHLVLEFARATVAAEDLGHDDVPDLLCIGLTGLARVAGATGPYSQESIDIVLRVDRLLGEFFDYLDDSIGEEDYALLLTSDRGVAPVPGFQPTAFADGDGPGGDGQDGDGPGRVHDDTSHVPALLVGPGVPMGRYDGRVATIDLAPTVARLLRLEKLPAIDGAPVEALLPAP